MAVAMLSPDPEEASIRGKKGGRGKVSANGQLSSITRQRLSDARAVLSYSRELAQAVMRAGKPLQAALAETRLSHRWFTMVEMMLLDALAAMRLRPRATGVATGRDVPKFRDYCSPRLAHKKWPRRRDGGASFLGACVNRSACIRDRRRPDDAHSIS